MHILVSFKVAHDCKFRTCRAILRSLPTAHRTVGKNSTLSEDEVSGIRLPGRLDGSVLAIGLFQMVQSFTLKESYAACHYPVLRKPITPAGRSGKI